MLGFGLHPPSKVFTYEKRQKTSGASNSRDARFEISYKTCTNSKMRHQHHNSHRWQHQSHLSFSLFLSSTCNEFLHLQCQKNLEAILIGNQSMNPSLIRKTQKILPQFSKEACQNLFHRLSKLIDAVRDRCVSNVMWIRGVSPFDEAAQSNALSLQK